MALLFLLFSGTIAVAPEARTHEMGQRSAEDVARQIRELYLNGQISITARGQQIEVPDEPSVLCEGNQKDKREGPCRYIARPAVAVPRLSLSPTGKMVYALPPPTGKAYPMSTANALGPAPPRSPLSGAAIRRWI